MTKSFLDEILNHLMKVDVLSLTEKLKLTETSGLSDQVSALASVVSAKEKGSDVLLHFLKVSDCPVAQLILHHGNTTHAQQESIPENPCLCLNVTSIVTRLTAINSTLKCCNPDTATL